MAQRIRQLEDALAILQSVVSTEPHPLLTDGLILTNSSTVKPMDVTAETMDALGTLTIGDSGESKYFGPSAGSEVRTLLCLGQIYFTDMSQTRKLDSAPRAFTRNHSILSVTHIHIDRCRIRIAPHPHRR